MPHFQITDVVLIHCNVVNNYYQHDSRVLYVFIHQKSFGQLLQISPKTFIFLKTLIQKFYLLEYGLLIKVLCR